MLGNKVVIEGVTFAVDQNFRTLFLDSGTDTVTIKHFLVHDAPDQSFEMINGLIKTRTDYAPEKDLLSCGEHVSADRLIINGASVEQGRMTMAVNNIKASVYDTFMRNYMTAFKSLLQTVSSGDDKVQQELKIRQEMLRSAPQLIASVEKLLAKGLEFHLIDVYAKIPKGKIEGDLRLGLSRDMSFMQFVPLATQPELAVDIFSLAVNCSLPRKLAGKDHKHIFTPLFPGMQTGLFIEKCKVMETHAEIRNHKFLLSGKELNLQALADFVDKSLFPGAK